MAALEGGDEGAQGNPEPMGLRCFDSFSSALGQIQAKTQIRRGTCWR